jgi:hypothetical protein
MHLDHGSSSLAVSTHIASAYYAVGTGVGKVGSTYTGVGVLLGRLPRFAPRYCTFITVVSLNDCIVTPATMTSSTYDYLLKELEGKIAQPHSDDYEASLKSYFTAQETELRPAFIIFPISAHDVSRILKSLAACDAGTEAFTKVAVATVNQTSHTSYWW